MGVIVEEGSSTEEEKVMQSIFALFCKDKSCDQADLIAVLQATQEAFGYLSKQNMVRIAEELDMSANEVYGVASFYSQFKFVKPGKHVLTVCLGTACFVKGGPVLSEAIETKLKIKPGETTEDGVFSFERVACLGCCALSPVVAIDGEVYASMTPAKLLRQINRIRKEEQG